MKDSIDTATASLVLTFDPGVLTASDENSKKASELINSNSDAGKIKGIQLDLKEVENVDSAGLNFLVSIIKLAKGKSLTVKATINNKSVTRIFKFTRMADLMEVEDLSGA